MVASRNRSCFSSRARFFLYLANEFPLARLHSEVRSNWCMIAETANLATAHNVVKRDCGARNAGLAGEHLRERSENLLSQHRTVTKRPSLPSKYASVRHAMSDDAFCGSRE